MNIEHVDHIVDMRRYLVMARVTLPAGGRGAAAQPGVVEQPVGPAQRSAAAWAEGLGVAGAARGGRTVPEYLYWVGCAGSFDDRAKKITQALAQMLQRAGVSTSRILGPEELLHRRPGAADRQRVPVPDARASRTSRR